MLKEVRRAIRIRAKDFIVFANTLKLCHEERPRVRK
jgi:hypothetical protein